MLSTLCPETLISQNIARIAIENYMRGHLWHHFNHFNKLNYVTLNVVPINGSTEFIVFCTSWIFRICNSIHICLPTCMEHRHVDNRFPSYSIVKTMRLASLVSGFPHRASFSKWSIGSVGKSKASVISSNLFVRLISSFFGLSLQIKKKCHE